MRKRLTVPQKRYTRIFAPDLSKGMNRFTDSRVLSFAEAEAAYNVSVESGALTDGYGVAEIACYPTLQKVFYYRIYHEETQSDGGYYLGYSAADGEMYAAETLNGIWQKLEGARFAAPPLGVNYRLYGEDVFLLCGEEGMAVVHPALTVVTVSAAPQITSLAMHNERMFVTIGGRKNAVWFSDDLDPTNWNPELDEGGFIELEGECGRLNKAVDFGGYVYIFRDYGISRLTAYGDQSDFSVTNLFVSSGRIYADTVAMCGDRILFCAEDGLYSFDGLTASRICRKLDGLFSLSPSPLGCYCAGKYYLAAAVAAAAETPAEAVGRTLLAVIDPRTKTVSVSRGISVETFSPLTVAEGESLIVTDGARLGTVKKGATCYGTPLDRIWRSGQSDLGRPESRKSVSDVYIDTLYDCTVTVSTERGSKRFAFVGKREVQRRRVNLIGTKVQLEIRAAGPICVARPAIKFTVVS